jgi:GNAT superfamily N-acetyltransferase
MADALAISQAMTPSEIEAVRELWREYTSWAFTLAPGSDQAPTFRNLEQELATLPGVYAPPTGRLLLAVFGGRPAGTVALKGHDSATGELKRLYVRPGFRGKNIGQHLVASLLAEARACGHRRLILDSHYSMTKAHEIYMAAGFRKVAAPEAFPEELKPIVVFMEMALA